MSHSGNFLIDLSILYRNTQKYFDRVMSSFEIGWGQLFFLFFVYEQEGITMQEITKNSEVDKGTTTKSMQRLVETGYVVMRTDEKDKRVKRLYTTEKTTALMNALYEYRSQYRSLVFEGLDGNSFETMIEQACANSRTSLDTAATSQHIWLGEMQPVTLVDYAPHIASTIRTAGCNFKCPNCSHKQLVFIPEDYAYLDSEEILTYLEKRKGYLQGVFVAGGEPLMQEGIFSFLSKIKEMGYLVKLNTNGSYPKALKQAIHSHLVDEVVLSIKQCKEKYAQSAGLQEDSFHIDNIEESVSYLLTSPIPYTFHTDVFAQEHSLEDFAAIGQWLHGAKHYTLHFDNDYPEETIEQIQAILKPHIQQIEMQKGETHASH